MDKLSILGMFLGLAAIIAGHTLEGGTLKSLVQPVALMIVGGGTMGAVLVQHSSITFWRSIKMVRWVFFPPDVNHPAIIEEIKQWSRIARREGLLALEAQILRVGDPLARKGLQMVVDGSDPQVLRSVLEIDVETYEAELREAANVWEAAGGYSPTIGIIGAVLGLIHVMENLTDPSKLGAGIATAFVATVYGVGLANLLYLPVANKLKHHAALLVQARQMVVDGLCGIAAGENPMLLENRLWGYADSEEQEQAANQQRQ